jgi:hypothetical protein
MPNHGDTKARSKKNILSVSVSPWFNKAIARVGTYIRVQLKKLVDEEIIYLVLQLHFRAEGKRDHAISGLIESFVLR